MIIGSIENNTDAKTQQEKDVDECAYDEIAATDKAINELGEEVYIRMLLLVARTWKGAAWSSKKEMIDGMSLFMQAYDGLFSKSHFIYTLGKASEEEIDRKANGALKNYPASLKYALAIAERYNKDLICGELPLIFLAEVVS